MFEHHDKNRFNTAMVLYETNLGETCEHAQRANLLHQDDCTELGIKEMHIFETLHKYMQGCLDEVHVQEPAWRPQGWVAVPGRNLASLQHTADPVLARIRPENDHHTIWSAIW